MRVRGLSSARGERDIGAPQKMDRAKEATEDKKGVSFIEELRKTTDIKTKEILDDVLGEIDEAAKAFLKQPVPANLLRYKGLVQRFMKTVISRLYRTRETLSSRAVDPQKIYTLLEEVDKNLKLLTEEVLSGQADSLSLMARIDEIRGLLVDLYH